MKIKQLLILLLGIAVISCTPVKKLTYLNDVEVDTKMDVNQNYALTLAPDDAIAIGISCESPSLVLPFLQGGASVSSVVASEVSGMGSTQQAEATDYLINSDGEILFPILGRIKVEGMTTSEVSKHIEKLIVDGGYINDPVVSVRLQNFKIVVLGDISSPGVKQFTSDRVSIFDVIATSGDIDASGLKQNVFLVREEGGERIVTQLDLTKADIFDSPYYYLQQNDIIYVKPNKRSARTGQMVNDDRIYSVVITFITSAISVLIGALLF